MIKKISIIFLILLILLFFLKTLNNEKYELSAEFEIKNYSCEFIDKNFAYPLQREILKISDIKNVVVFSFDEKLYAYFKIKPFVLNKKNSYSKIENKIIEFLKNKKEIHSFKINNKYNINYSHLLIIQNPNYLKLKKESEDILNNILQNHLTDNFFVFGLRKIANFIFFSNNNLIKFNLDFNDIQNLIKSHNPQGNYIKENILINGKLNSINDIKNIPVFYMDKNFSTKLANVFKTEETTDNYSEVKVYYNKNDALAIALSKNKVYPEIIFKLKLWMINKDCNFKIEKIKNLKKIEIFQENNADIEKINDFYKKLQEILKEDILYFIGEKLPDREIFCPIYQNRITIYINKKNYKKIKKILNENKISYFDENSKNIFIYDENIFNLEKKKGNYSNFETIGTIKNSYLKYEIKNEKLNDYFLSKNDVLNSIKSTREGVILDSYILNNNEIDIVLKNKNKDSYIYSKKYKNLIDSKIFIKEDIKTNYKVIARKNFKYFSILKVQNPS